MAEDLPIIGHPALEAALAEVARLRRELDLAQLPWKRPPLDSWRICGMNHYRKNGADYIFVAMVKGMLCIKMEGVDGPMIWRELAKRAEHHRMSRFTKDGYV